MIEKLKLFKKSLRLMKRFCGVNNIPEPKIKCVTEKDGDNCGYYYRNKIVVLVDKCARIGRFGKMWSYPGHTVDRTPYGVLQHEFGYYIDSKYHLNSERF